MRLIYTLLIFAVAFTACKDKVICPAFQSTYILDDSVRMAYYSYLWKIDEAERTRYLSSLNKPSGSVATVAVADSSASATPDSTDVVLTASIAPATPVKKDYFAHAGQYIVPEKEVKKTKYGIRKEAPYYVKLYRLKTAPMENVLSPELPPQPEIQEDTSAVEVGEFYASDFSDSLAQDSSQVAMQQDSLKTESFELPTLARAPPPEKKQPTKYLYRYDPKDKMLNVEQDYYNKYFGEYLIQKPRKASAKPEPTKASADSTSLNKGQGNMLAPQQSDSTSGGGLFKRKKRAKTEKKENVPEEAPAEKEEVEEQPAEKPKEETEPEDDGF